MAKHRSHSIEFKRQVAQEFLAGETLHGLAKRHYLSRNLVRLWIQYEAGALFLWFTTMPWCRRAARTRRHP